MRHIIIAMAAVAASLVVSGCDPRNRAEAQELYDASVIGQPNPMPGTPIGGDAGGGVSPAPSPSPSPSPSPMPTTPVQPPINPTTQPGVPHAH